MPKPLKIRDLTLRCPHCRAKITTDPINSGRCIPCPTCAEPLQIPHDLPCPVGESYIVPTILCILVLLAGLAPSLSAFYTAAAIASIILLSMIAGHLGAILRRLKHLEELSATLPRQPPEPPRRPSPRILTTLEPYPPMSRSAPFRPVLPIPPPSRFPHIPPPTKRKPRFHGAFKMVEAEGLEPTTR